ncbi:hydroxyacid dehydrogenase [Candidatus Poribacteria bacterium]|nr:hydroxyacid dehydrogenase [Candidatus Poribacteria bacterium]
MEKFRIGLTKDFLSEKGELVYKDIGLKLLDDIPNVEYEFMKEYHPEITPDQIKDYDGVISLRPKYTHESFRSVERLTAIGRFGVGYEMVDLDACTKANVMLFITPDGVRRPVAEGVVTLMLAICHRLLIKDKLTRTGRWNERIFHMGMELRDRVLGSVGLGNIGSEVFRLVKPFGMKRFLAYDPYVKKERADELGVEIVDLDTVMMESDFVTINAPLTTQTYHIIGARELALMKPTAYFINTSRGGLVDQKALTEVLENNRIQGAGLDVFEEEPIRDDDPLLKLENVILCPHSICWTDECFRDNGTLDCRGLIKVMQGEIPDHVVNKEVLEKDELKAKLENYKRKMIF